jgi:hypothetical protein
LKRRVPRPGTFRLRRCWPSLQRLRVAGLAKKRRRVSPSTGPMMHWPAGGGPSGGKSSIASPTALGDVIDRSLHAATARFTAGLSPAALAEAYIDWATHLASSPGKRMQLLEKATKKAVRLARHTSQCLPGARGYLLHQAAAAGPALRRGSVATLAVQSDLSELPAAAALVAQRNDRRARRDSAARERCHVRGQAAARRHIAQELLVHESRDPAAYDAARRHEPHARRTEFRRGLERAISGKKPLATETFQVGRDVRFAGRCCSVTLPAPAITSSRADLSDRPPHPTFARLTCAQTEIVSAALPESSLFR